MRPLLNMEEVAHVPENEDKLSTNLNNRSTPNNNDPNIKVSTEIQNAFLFLRYKYGINITGVSLSNAAIPIKKPADFELYLDKK
jgi:hypothetical protein